MMMRDALRGRLLVAAATVCWGTSATLARYMFRDRAVPPLHAVEMRLVIAATLLGLYLLARRRRALVIDRRDWGYFIVLGLFGMAAVQGTYYMAIAALGVGLAILIQYLAPALIVLFDFLRGERVRALTMAGALGAIAGIALLVGDVNPATVGARPVDWAVGFAAAFSFAIYIVMSKRGLSRYPPETVLFYTFLIAGIFWTLVIPPWRIAGAGYAPEIWLAFAALGIFNTLVPFALFYAGLRRLTASQTAIMATLEPVVAVMSAAVFLGEGLTLMQWGGALLVLAASVLTTERRPETLPAQAERG